MQPSSRCQLAQTTLIGGNQQLCIDLEMPRYRRRRLVLARRIPHLPIPDASQPLVSAPPLVRRVFARRRARYHCSCGRRRDRPTISIEKVWMSPHPIKFINCWANSLKKKAARRESTSPHAESRLRFQLILTRCSPRNKTLSGASFSLASSKHGSFSLYFVFLLLSRAVLLDICCLEDTALPEQVHISFFE